MSDLIKIQSYQNSKPPKFKASKKALQYLQYLIKLAIAWEAFLYPKYPHRNITARHKGLFLTSKGQASPLPDQKLQGSGLHMPQHHYSKYNPFPGNAVSRLTSSLPGFVQNQPSFGLYRIFLQKSRRRAHEGFLQKSDHTKDRILVRL